MKIIVWITPARGIKSATTQVVVMSVLMQLIPKMVRSNVPRLLQQIHIQKIPPLSRLRGCLHQFLLMICYIIFDSMSNLQVMRVFCVIWQAALPPQYFILWLDIRIDHDAVCIGVVGTAMPNIATCAGRCADACGRHNECSAGFSTNYDTTKHISGQFLFYHEHNFTKSKGNLCFGRLVPLFVPIGVCVTTYDDGTASDVTIGL